MKILVSVNHPAHVHLFKNFIWEMEKKEHDIQIVARDKEVTKYLLDKYGFEYQIISKKMEHPFGWSIEAITRLKRLLKNMPWKKPDITLSILDPTIGFYAKIVKAHSIHLTDTEHASLLIKTGVPLADTILTPSSFLLDLGEKQVRYNGYHELAYLHPNYFKPDPAILDQLGLSKGDTFFLLRFISWTASHDIGHRGITNRIKIVEELKKYGTVLISSESRLNKKLEKYRVKIPPEKIHDVLYYATLYIGEGATMASEAAVLGTPAVYISSLAWDMGNFIELETRYGLVFRYPDETGGIQKALEILKEYDKNKWRKKQKKLLHEKIDVTKFMVRFIEDYPVSIEETQEKVQKYKMISHK